MHSGSCSNNRRMTSLSMWSTGMQFSVKITSKWLTLYWNDPSFSDYRVK